MQEEKSKTQAHTHTSTKSVWDIYDDVDKDNAIYSMCIYFLMWFLYSHLIRSDDP